MVNFVQQILPLPVSGDLRRNKIPYSAGLSQLNSAQVDTALRELYGLMGKIPDAELEARQAALMERQAELRDFRSGVVGPVTAGAVLRAKTIFPKKPYVPIKDSVKRRKRFERLAATQYLPDPVRNLFTPGQVAVITIYLAEIRRQGFCDLSNKEICDRAGVTDPVRRLAMRTAQAEGLFLKRERPVKGAKHRTNVVVLDEGSDLGAVVAAWMRDGYRLTQAEKRVMLIGVTTVRPLENLLHMKGKAKALRSAFSGGRRASRGFSEIGLQFNRTVELNGRNQAS